MGARVDAMWRASRYESARESLQMGARVATNGRASRRNVARESPVPVLHSAPCRASGAAHYRGRVDAGTQLGLDALDPDFVPRPLVRVTPARLGTWADCPRRYRLTYLDRPPPPRAGARAASTLGAVVHLALRALYALPDLERTPAAGAALVDRYWSNEGFRDAAQAAAYRLRAADWVADYAAGSGASATPLAVERWVTVATRADRRGGTRRPDRPSPGSRQPGRAGHRRLQDGPRANERGRAPVVGPCPVRPGRAPHGAPSVLTGRAAPSAHG